jgi:Dimethyladenosine transferase (rRNA methylation)
MTFMIQKEVAEQICAKEGKFSFLSAYINLFSNAKKIFDVSPKSFNPVPKVVSSVIEIQPLEKNILANSEIDAFIEFLTFGFKSPRKQIHNSLSDGLFLKLDCSKKIIEKAEIETTRRPSTLTIFEWKKLFHIWLDFDSPKNTPGSIRRK